MRKILCILLVLFTIFLTGCDKKEIEVDYFEEFDSSRVYNCGYALISYYDFNESENYYFIDTTGKRAFNKTFQEAKPFDKGVTVVRYNGQAYFMDYKGNFISEGYRYIAQESYHYHFGEQIKTEYYIASTEDYNEYIYTSDGKLVFNKSFDNYYSGSGKNNPVFTVWEQESNKYGVVDNEGNIFIDIKYEYISRMCNGYAITLENESDNYKIIDEYCNVIVEKLDYINIEQANSDLILVSKIIAGGINVQTIFNTKGEEVLKEGYTFESFVKLNAEFYFVAKKDDKYSLFNSNGEVVIEESDSIVKFEDYLIVNKATEAIVYNESLEQVFKYDNAKLEVLDDGYIGIFKNNDKMTLCNNSFKELFEINCSKDYYKVINNYIVFYEYTGSTMKVYFFDKISNQLKAYETEGVELFNVTFDPITLDYYISYSMIESPSSSNYHFKHGKIEGDTINVLGEGLMTYSYDGYLYLNFYDYSDNKKIVKDNKKVFEGRISNYDRLFYFNKDSSHGIMRYDGKVIAKQVYVNWR